MVHLWQKLTTLQFFRLDRPGAAGGGDNGNACDEKILPQATRDYLEGLTGSPCGNGMLYRIALTHRSLLHDFYLSGNIPESNQRLEFLGDAVLDLLISEFLYKQFPASDEGHLSNNRSKIVNRKSLATFALKLNLGEHLIIGDSAEKQRIRTSEASLADAFEALIGAIYLDLGLAGAERFMLNHVIGLVNLERLVEEEYNYKSRLIEYTQSRQLPPPHYTVVSAEGAEHEKTFSIVVTCMGVPLGRGMAPRKKDAEQLAAREAMTFLENHDPFTPEPGLEA